MRLKSLLFVAVTVAASVIVSNAVYADPSGWEQQVEDVDLLNHVMVDTYDQHISSLPLIKFKIPLTEDVRTNISQYLGVNRTEFSSLQYLWLVLNEETVVDRGSREMLLRPHQVFLDQIPKVFADYPTSDVRTPITDDDGDPILRYSPTPHNATTPHNDFDIGASVNIDARVFGLNSQVEDLVRYDREYVNFHTMLYTPHDERGQALPDQTHWTFGRSPNNCHLRFQSDNQSHTVLSLVDFNGGPVGTLNGRAATGLTPVANALTLNIITPAETADYINNLIESSLLEGMSTQERWKNVFLDLFRRGNISAEVMHHLLDFSVADLGVQPLAIVPAPLREAAAPYIAEEPAPTFVPPHTADEAFVPPHISLAPVVAETVSVLPQIVTTPQRPSSSITPPWSMSSGIPNPPLDEETLEVFRVYNPNNGMHHYTMNKEEVAALVALGWRDEGVAFRYRSADGVPVYRLYNPNSGIHHFTINANEKDALVAAGWQYEGIAWYARAQGTVPVYRIYNPTNGEHVWTTNYAEVENAVAHGWNNEGIAWYIV
ncbi:MAG: hypothetical protein LBF32_00790 [Streptococcaceae bacterium]|nr:hypothetical protein [Streptococcaceae bacterium]